MLGVEGGSNAGFLAGFSLETLIAPFELSEFTEDHWDRAPLVLQRRLPNFYDGLVAPTEIDTAVATGALLSSYVDAKTGTGRTWAMERAVPNRPATDTLLARMADGATLVMDHADATLTGLGRMCRLLMAETGHAWHCNVYATPPGGQGFQAHVDDTGVFILQVLGAKEWTFGTSQLSRPVAGETGGAAPDGWTDDAETVQLVAGDLLYLPRGVAHAARASVDAASLHITLTVAEVSWAQAFDVPDPTKLAHTSDLRDLLPLGFHQSADFETEFLNRMPGVEQSKLDQFFEAQARQFYPDFSGRFSRSLNPVDTTEHTQFHQRKDVFWRILNVDDVCHLLSGPIRLAFPQRARAFVETLMTRGGVLSQIDTDLTRSERIAIGHSLAQHNLIQRI